MASKPSLYQASYNRLFGGKCQRLRGSERFGAPHVSFARGVLKCFEVNLPRKGMLFSICSGKEFAGGKYGGSPRKKLVNQIGMEFRIVVGTTIVDHCKPVVRIRSLKQGGKHHAAGRNPEQHKRIYFLSAQDHLQIRSVKRADAVFGDENVVLLWANSRMYLARCALEHLLIFPGRKPT
jgi:hypothetical protein